MINFAEVVKLAILEGYTKKITLNSTPLWEGIKKIETVPAQSGTLTYTGSALTPTWSNYNSEQLTIGGTTSATNAGTHTATFTPKSGYSWADGSINAVSVNWIIGKAEASLSISPTTAELESRGDSCVINIATNSDGNIEIKNPSSIFSNNFSYAISTSAIRITAKTEVSDTIGSAIIPITIAIKESDNYKASPDVQFRIKTSG